MVFHEIDSITDVISNHRIIIYYIEGKLSSVCTKRNDTKFLETVMEMLEKKNDDLLIIKVLHDSLQFNQFQEIYKAEVTGAVTLFVVNNEGIPLMCEQMNLAENVPDIIKTMCTTCKLNSVSIEDLKHISHNKTEPTLINQSISIIRNSNLESNNEVASQPIPKVQHSKESLDTAQNDKTISTDDSILSTKLQIRLPNGEKDQQKFDKDAMLQEVWVFISTKHRLKDFDLKTYNHQIFSEDEYEKTLQELDLCPNGVIIVVEKNCITQNAGGFKEMFQYGYSQIITKTFSLFHYVQGLLTMLWQSFFFSNSDNGSEQGRKSVTPGNMGKNNSKPHSSTKKFGNIHTLKRNEDSDDEQNRYNGNSTQQK